MWFLESPVPVLAVGGGAVLVLTAAFLRSGSRNCMYGIAITALLTLVGVLVEQKVVTTREEVGNMLNALAEDLESNDREAIVRHVATTSKELLDETEQLLRKIVVDRAVVKRNLEVEADQSRAEARFNGVIVASHKSGAVRQQFYPRYFILKLRKEEGQWRGERIRTSPTAQARTRRSGYVSRGRGRSRTSHSDGFLAQRRSSPPA